MAQITVLGEVVIDRIIGTSGLTDLAGGSAANCALALSKIGNDVFFRARYSQDAAGEFLYQAALANGLNVEHSIRASQPATIVEVHVGESGTPSYDFQMQGTADWAWTTEELNLHDVTKNDSIVFGSLAAVLEPAHSVIYKWLEANKNEGLLIAYDPNARPSAVSKNDESLVRERMSKLVQISNVVKVSDEDLEWIEPVTDSHSTASKWSLAGPDLVVLTKGENGVAAFRNGLCIAEIPGTKVDVADTVGAGDTLMAWLVSGLLSVNKNLRFNAGSVELILKNAVRAAAITCSRTGCQPPTLEELGL